MKTNRFFGIFAAAAMLVSSVACEKEPQTEGPDNEKPNEETPVELSKEAKLTALTLTAGSETFEGFVYETDKVVEISYLGEQFDALKSATAEVTVSDKATVSPDPAEARDYTVEGGVVFTVTAEDGKTKTEYTVELVEAIVEIKATEVWKKTIATLEFPGHLQSDCGIAFCGEGLFALSNGAVYNLEGNKVGSLNLEGVANAGLENFEFTCMTNDKNGLLVASVGFNAAGGCPIPAPGDDQIATSKIYAWPNGYDKAPIEIFDQPGGNNARYISVAGDIKNGPAILMVRMGAGNPTVFHHWTAPSGINANIDQVGAAWMSYNSTLAGTDGCWGTQISATDAENPTYFIWDSEAGGQSVYSRAGVDGELVSLTGTIIQDGIYDNPEYSGMNGKELGNYTVGHVCPMVFDGKAYAIMSTSGWQLTFLTIVDAANENYLLRTQAFDGGGDGSFPCAAYWYEAATQTGHVVFLKQNDQIAKYSITKEII